MFTSLNRNLNVDEKIYIRGDCCFSSNLDIPYEVLRDFPTFRELPQNPTI